MIESLRRDADRIVAQSIARVLPDEAVHRALAHHVFAPGRVVLVAVGKAAWQMARAAGDALGTRLETGIVITKYGHLGDPLSGMQLWEAGHPVPDGNTYRATQAALRLVRGLTGRDEVLFLLSGGGSALFESPLLPPGELEDLTGQLLRCGADIVEINTLRKRWSGVKGGRFALACRPARVFGVVLSDIVGDPLDMIGSGPAAPDRSTCAQALAIAEKYGLRLSPLAARLLRQETPKVLDNVETVVTGSVRELCRAAMDACRARGYEPQLVTDSLTGEARLAGERLAALLRARAGTGRRAFVMGGETVVHVTGDGLGGRNQELALAAAPGIAGLKAAVCSVGSDGTDGPTDAAGGYVDGDSAAALRARGLEAEDVLRRNDAYHALRAVDGLVFTGPTGTNVNDVAVGLLEG